MKEWNPQITVISGEIHRQLLRLAYDYAWLKSDDQATKMGALIIDKNLTEILSQGANQFPEGITFSNQFETDLILKNKTIIHAEIMAISYAKEHGINIRGATMYMPWIPCTFCLATIIEAGISELISHKQMIIRTPKHWYAEYYNSINIINNSNINLRMYDGKIGVCKGIVRNVAWNP